MHAEDELSLVNDPILRVADPTTVVDVVAHGDIDGAEACDGFDAALALVGTLTVHEVIVNLRTLI